MLCWGFVHLGKHYQLSFTPSFVFGGFCLVGFETGTQVAQAGFELLISYLYFLSAGILIFSLRIRN